MAELIRMPKMSDTMTEGVIAEWHKKVGDLVKSGDVLAEVETDKATMDLESYDDGTLLYIGAEKGQAVPIDGVLAVIGTPGEAYQGLLDDFSSSQIALPEAPKKLPVTTPTSTGTGAQQAITQTSNMKAVSTTSINATAIRMPKMSDTMTEGTIVVWHKKEGDTVKSGDILAEVETDKATMDLESYEDGTLLYIGVKEGGSVAVDDIIAVVGEKGTDFKVLLQGNSQPVTPALTIPVSEASPLAHVTTNTASTTTNQNGRTFVSPLAKRIAEERGISLSEVQGSGDGGRIVKRDIEEFDPRATTVSTQQAVIPRVQSGTGSMEVLTTQGGFEDIPVSQMRKTIARRLSESLFTAPHFYLTMEINMDKAVDLREKVNEVSPVKISFNDFVLKATALALKRHPAVNSSWLGDKIRRYNYVNIGVAVAVDEGLLVPVIRDADQKALSVIASEVKELASKAKDKKLQPKEWEGSTFSISNLGMFGIDEFTAIINPPDSCIMAIGSIKQVVSVVKGEFKAIHVMKVTLSCDHRVVDGATGAAFLQTFKQLLEGPMQMLI